ncbi:MAG: hypothetical protein K8R77_00970 [Anaerolineaceae bacterium]|nr:hypothetical protein [Anaerolineaceae bacterium]
MSTNETSDGLNSKIENWLNKQGYPLEINVARSFRKAGFQAIQSDYYVDPESENYREIDILAINQKKFNSHLVEVSLHIECKTSIDKPWIIFSSSDIRLFSYDRVSQRIGSDYGLKYLNSISDQSEIYNSPLFKNYLIGLDTE